MNENYGKPIYNSERYIMKRNRHLRFLNQSCLTLLLAAAAMPATFAADVPAKAPAVDPAATQILKRMTDYLGGLQQFSVYLDRKSVV